ncbi:MAG: hypothetical protein HY059_09225 [Proteobacteria bacterium]|nr:hypothetical protein [Pseudomonadota bacterium]
MLKNTLLLAAAVTLALPVSSFAKVRPSKSKGVKPHASGPTAQAEAALKAYQDAEHDCARANSKYHSKSASAGSHNKEELRKLGHDKDSACSKAMGAYTSFANAYGAAIKNQKGVIAEKQAEYDKEAKEPKPDPNELNEIKGEIADAKKSLSKLEHDYTVHHTNNTRVKR